MLHDKEEKNLDLSFSPLFGSSIQSEISKMLHRLQDCEVKLLNVDPTYNGATWHSLPAFIRTEIIREEQGEVEW